MMKPVMQSNYSVDIFNLNPYQNFQVGDMVVVPSTGHIGILLEQEQGRTGFWLVEWFMNPTGSILKKRVQTYEYDKSLKLYAKAVDA